MNDHSCWDRTKEFLLNNFRVSRRFVLILPVFCIFFCGVLSAAFVALGTAVRETDGGQVRIRYRRRTNLSDEAETMIIGGVITGGIVSVIITPLAYFLLPKTADQSQLTDVYRQNASNNPRDEDDKNVSVCLGLTLVFLFLAAVFTAPLMGDRVLNKGQSYETVIGDYFIGFGICLGILSILGFYQLFVNRNPNFLRG